MTDSLPVRNSLRGPEPPFLGAVYVSTRGRTGRRWEVVQKMHSQLWRLRPMGDDVSHTGGGVRNIVKGTEELQDRKRWRMVGVTGRSVLA